MINFKQWLKMKEMVGTDVVGLNNCAPTADYQVWGACSEKKVMRKNKKKKKKK